MDLLRFYAQLLLCTAGVLILCGLVVTVLQRLFVFFIGRSLGYRAILATAIIGTPIHEVGHAMMCYLFAHHVDEVVLYRPDPSTGQLGYVKHTYSPRNLYQQLGNFFIGLGPIFSGCTVITAVLFLCFPHAIRGFFNEAFEIIAAEGSLTELISCALNFIVSFFTDDGGHWFAKVLGAIVILSVMLHVNLSTKDIQNSLPGAGLYAALVFVFASVIYLIGPGAKEGVERGAQIFFSYCLVMFMVIFVFSALILAVAAILYLIRLWTVKSK